MLAIDLGLKTVIPFSQEVHPNHWGSQGGTLSPGQVDVNRLVLVALEHVSMGSWQPHLRLI